MDSASGVPILPANNRYFAGNMGAICWLLVQLAGGRGAAALLWCQWQGSHAPGRVSGFPVNLSVLGIRLSITPRKSHNHAPHLKALCYPASVSHACCIQLFFQIVCGAENIRCNFHCAFFRNPHSLCSGRKVDQRWCVGILNGPTQSDSCDPSISGFGTTSKAGLSA